MRKYSSGTLCLDNAIGKVKQYIQFYAVSDKAREYAMKFKPRETDVIVCTYSKTGTTLVQQICQQIRSPAGISDAEAMQFEDITAEQIWIDFAFDVRVDLSESQRFDPRVFKSHQPLSSINRGCKYITTIRRPCDTARSYYYFYRAKDHPSTRDLSLDEWVLKWAEEGTWAPPIFDHYVEYAQCRHLPCLLLLIYEDIVANPEVAVRDIASHMSTDSSVELSDSRVAEIVRRSSKSFMSEYVGRFDDHWLAEKQRQFGCPRRLSPSAKVVRDGAKREKISSATLEALGRYWRLHVTPTTGFASYDEFCDAVRAERGVADEVRKS